MRMKVAKKKKIIPSYTYLGCPLTHNFSPKCFRMCAPDGEGRGVCGRIAPHSMRSRFQQAIDNYRDNSTK